METLIISYIRVESGRWHIRDGDKGGVLCHIQLSAPVEERNVRVDLEPLPPLLCNRCVRMKELRNRSRIGGELQTCKPPNRLAHYHNHRQHRR